ncbi:t-SNARE domain-containing protein 1 [Branchiostoma belcheri]|nr:t-SNARE domain-containing protein 1 [Branchiostoma belcheri]
MRWQTGIFRAGASVTFGGRQKTTALTPTLLGEVVGSTLSHPGHGLRSVWEVASRDTHASTDGHRGTLIEETAERTVEGLKGCVRLSGRSCWRCSKRAEEKRILCLPTSVTWADVVKLIKTAAPDGQLLGKTDPRETTRGNAAISSLWLKSFRDVHDNAVWFLVREAIIPSSTFPHTAARVRKAAVRSGTLTNCPNVIIRHVRVNAEHRWAARDLT